MSIFFWFFIFYSIYYHFSMLSSWNFYIALFGRLALYVLTAAYIWISFLIYKIFFFNFKLPPWLRALNNEYYCGCSRVFNYFLRISLEYDLINFLVLYLRQALWIFLAHAIRKISLILNDCWLSLLERNSFSRVLISMMSTSEIWVVILSLTFYSFSLP